MKTLNPRTAGTWSTSWLMLARLSPPWIWQQRKQIHETYTMLSSWLGASRNKWQVNNSTGLEFPPCLYSLSGWTSKVVKHGSEGCNLASNANAMTVICSHDGFVLSCKYHISKPEPYLETICLQQTNIKLQHPGDSWAFPLTNLNTYTERWKLLDSPEADYSTQQECIAEKIQSVCLFETSFLR